MATETDGRIKQLAIPHSTLPRYWWTYFDNGVENIQMKLEMAKETSLGSNGYHVGFEKAQIVFWYQKNIQVSR